VGPPQSVEIAGVKIENCTRIEPTDNSEIYELIWERYVAYGVVNESFAAARGDQIFEGKRLRTSSTFSQSIRRAFLHCDPDTGQHIRA
jgi:hypothetical protein